MPIGKLYYLECASQNNMRGWEHAPIAIIIDLLLSLIICSWLKFFYTNVCVQSSTTTFSNMFSFLFPILCQLCFFKIL